MPKLNLTQEEKTLLIRVSLSMGIAILIGIASIEMLFSEAHDPTITAPSQQQVQALPSLNPVSPVNQATDPYAAYSPEQVVQAYLTAYQADDWNTCKALMAPMVLAGWTTPNELQAQAEQVQRERGQLTVTNHGQMAGSDTGTEVKFVVNYRRNLGTNTPALSGVSNRLGDAPGDTPTPASTAAKDDFSFITLKRVGNSWKIDDYTVF